MSSGLREMSAHVLRHRGKVQANRQAGDAQTHGDWADEPGGRVGDGRDWALERRLGYGVDARPTVSARNGPQYLRDNMAGK
jgi:hypothetical protein